MKWRLFLLCLLLSPLPVTAGQDYDAFRQEFRTAAENGIDDEGLSRVFSNYPTLIFPHFSTNRLINGLKGNQTTRYPLQRLKTEPFYLSSIQRLVFSSRDNDRLLSYLVLGSANDRRYNRVLLTALKAEEKKNNRLWACISLLYLQDKHTDELFDCLLEHENFHDAHLFPYFISLDRASLQKTAYKRMGSSDSRARILAVQTLAMTGLNDRTDRVVREAVGDWEPEIKGYAINAMMHLRMGDLKPILAPLLEQKNIRSISLKALANSPSCEDQEYLASLYEAQEPYRENILDAYFSSKEPEMVSRWLDIVATGALPDDYVFFVFKQPLLKSDALLDKVKGTIRKTKNMEVLQELPRALAGREDDDSVALLVSLMSHPDSTVRYWAGFSLEGNRSPILVSALPGLMQNPTTRTVALTELLIDNKIDNLQQTFEAYWQPGKKTSRDWRRASIEYLSAYPLPRHRELFRRILQDPKEDSFVKRSATLGLGRLKDESSVELIISAMKEEEHSDYNAITYLEALGNIKGARAREVIEAYADSSEARVREQAREILKNW